MGCETCKHWRNGLCHASEDMGETGMYGAPLPVELQDLNLECADWEKAER